MSAARSAPSRTAGFASSTFSHRDDLIDRVFSEPARDVGFYLDSGWPGDNYEVTVGMAMALISRGWEYGRNLLHLCFSNAGHGEEFRGTRLHLPLQFLNGAVARAYRVNKPVPGELPYRNAPASSDRPRLPLTGSAEGRKTSTKSHNAWLGKGGACQRGCRWWDSADNGTSCTPTGSPSSPAP